MSSYFRSPETAALSHPARGKICTICGEETAGEHIRELHAQASVVRFCDICGADKANGEPCDAGLHS